MLGESALPCRMNGKCLTGFLKREAVLHNSALLTRQALRRLLAGLEHPVLGHRHAGLRHEADQHCLVVTHKADQHIRQMSTTHG